MTIGLGFINRYGGFMFMNRVPYIPWPNLIAAWNLVFCQGKYSLYNSGAISSTWRESYIHDKVWNASPSIVVNSHAIPHINNVK